MGVIKEPKGIDFIVDSSSMTDADRKKISQWISKRKATINHMEAMQNLLSKAKKKPNFKYPK